MAARKKAHQAKKAKKSRRPVAAKAVRSTKAKPSRKPAPKKSAKRPAPKVAVKAAKKRAPKAVARKPARKTAAKSTLRREDHAGHLDPKYARDLRRQSGRPEAEPESFVGRPRSKDDLVEGLGEEFVQQATSAEYEGEDQQQVTEERGGPFVETSAGTEFAEGTDASNPKGSTREPFPRT